MNLSIIYYSACRISDRFGDAVRAELVRAVAGRFPIISVMHKPIDFGDIRVVVGDVVPSIAQVYRNILIGCEMATTAFCAFAEDDTCYVPEHFDYRPEPDVFAYNEHRYVITKRVINGRSEAIFYFRTRTQMAQGICSRDLMIDALTEKFARYPDPPLDTNVAKKAGFGEPGRYEKNLKLSPRKMVRFPWTDRPNVTWNAKPSLMGRRQWKATDRIVTDLPPWGPADALWQRIHG